MLIGVLGTLIVGCSTAGGAANSGPPSPGSQSSATSSAPASASTPTATPTIGISSAPPVPLLGQSRGITKGYGSVRPTTIDNGGDPTGVVTDLSWTTWGGTRAVGTGMAYYDPPNVPVVNATKEQATVSAFDLGTCDGQYMYQAIEWYFPESGGSFNATTYLNVCSWTYSNA